LYTDQTYSWENTPVDTNKNINNKNLFFIVSKI